MSIQPDQRLISAAFPCAAPMPKSDRWLDAVLDTVLEKDLLLADRNFCTTEFLFGLASRGASFLIRQHATTLWGKELLGKRRRIGRGERGVVYEQTLRIIHPRTDEQLLLRRITIVLDRPTTDGDTELHLLTNLPKRFGAGRLAAAYLQRWRIETLFRKSSRPSAAKWTRWAIPKRRSCVRHRAGDL